MAIDTRKCLRQPVCLLGLIHLFSGVYAKMIMEIKEGNVVDAIFDAVPIILMITGVAFPAAGVLITVPEILSTVGKYIAIFGAIMMIVGNLRSSKNVILGIGGGLYGIYSTASGYLGDVLSYSRLLALGLVTGSVASVFNMIGTLPNNMIFKCILFPIVFILGHSVNFALNALGAYVHTNRLQFIELFSKFYEGGGRRFNPLRVSSKYIKFKEDY